MDIFGEKIRHYSISEFLGVYTWYGKVPAWFKPVSTDDQLINNGENGKKSPSRSWYFGILALVAHSRLPGQYNLPQLARLLCSPPTLGRPKSFYVQKFVWQKFGWRSLRKINWLKNCRGALGIEDRERVIGCGDSSHYTLAECTFRFIFIFPIFISCTEI